MKDITLMLAKHMPKSELFKEIKRQAEKCETNPEDEKEYIVLSSLCVTLLSKLALEKYDGDINKLTDKLNLMEKGFDLLTSHEGKKN